MSEEEEEEEETVAMDTMRPDSRLALLAARRIARSERPTNSPVDLRQLVKNLFDEGEGEGWGGG